VVTFAKSDYSNCFAILRAIEGDSDLMLHLIVSGMHLSPEFGYTIKEIWVDGFEISGRVVMLLSNYRKERIWR